MPNRILEDKIEVDVGFFSCLGFSEKSRQANDDKLISTFSWGHTCG